MPAAAPWIAAAVAASTATYSGIQANEDRQKAKGAAQAQETAADAKIKAGQDLDIAKQKNASEAAAASAAGNANSAAAILLARKRTLIGGSSTAQSSILSDPTSGAAPTITKTLLGM